MRSNYTDLVEVSPSWLIEFLTNMIAENEDQLIEAIRTNDWDYVRDIIGKHIY